MCAPASVLAQCARRIGPCGRERRAEARRNKVEWETVAQRPAARYEKAEYRVSMSGEVAQKETGDDQEAG